MFTPISTVNLGVSTLLRVKSSYFSGFTAIVAAAGILAASSALSPAFAFSFSSQTDAQGKVIQQGSPAQDLSNVTIRTEDIGQMFEVNWLLSAGTKNNDGKSAPVDLSATGLFKVINFTQNLLSLEIKLTNNTQQPANDPNFNAAILSTGFGVTPDPNRSQGKLQMSLSQPGSVFKNIAEPTNQNFPGGFKNIDVCIFAANNCSGGNVNNGLQLGGKSDTFKVNIAGNFTDSFGMNYVTLSSLPLKFQTAAGSFELAGQQPRKKVPESGTTAALGLTALGAVVFLKRKVVSSPS